MFLFFVKYANQLSIGIMWWTLVEP